MRLPTFLLGWSLAFCPITIQAGEADDALLEAAAKGDAPRIVLALSEADPNIRDKAGRTPLMLAAQSGDFESVRRLLWGKADARLKDNDGKIARDYLDLKGEAFAPLALILRCYAFCEEYGRPGTKAKIPHLTLVNDLWVDPSHPKLKPHYLVNEAELKGKMGVDDDKNGFIDDIYGWNLRHDEPLRAPQLSIDATDETKKYLSDLLVDFNKATYLGDQKTLSILQGRYKNPLIHQIGFDTVAGVNIDLNDFTYATMLNSASHGTHVAGIVAKYSEGKAKLTGAAIGASAPTTNRVFDDFETIARIASETPDYATFVSALLDRYRAQAISQGRRSSDYLRACGAGVANMSWGWPRTIHENIAKALAEIYKQHGKNPDSINNPANTKDALTISNLPLELTVAHAAAFALAFYENPDVLIVMAAGNDKENNDDLLPSPQYLSRFFPNVMTVASVNDKGIPSPFTNHGVRSVQIAALGERVVSTMLAGLEAPMDGTSMASPVVAGTAAGIRADFPQLTATDVRRLLEASVTRSEGLAKLVSTSGILNAKAARQMAASWSKDNLAMLVEETRRAKVEGRDGPQLNVPLITSGILKKLTLKGAPRRITSVSGFGKNWRVVMSRGTKFDNQKQLGVGPWPSQAVEAAWSEGLRISSVAGEQGGWNVVMSSGIPGYQTVLGFDLDQNKIAENMNAGFRITGVAGWKNEWVVVMNTESRFGNQRYTLPTPLNDSRKEWIKQRWNEGYRITAVGGDDDPKHDDDGWLFVMTQNSGFQEQTFSEPGPWPAQWIEENTNKGFAITSVAGFNDHMIVVMSKGTALKEQDSSPAGLYPVDWIKERW
jgi:ankyrin repeat protein